MSPKRLVGYIVSRQRDAEGNEHQKTLWGRYYRREKWRSAVKAFSKTDSKSAQCHAAPASARAQTKVHKIIFILDMVWWRVVGCCP